MLKKITDLFIHSTFDLAGLFQKKAMRLAQIEATSYYLKGVQMIRRQCLTLLGVVLCLALLAVGVVVLPMMFVVISPIEPSVKLTLILILAFLDVGLPGLFLARFFSQKHWLEFSKTNEMIKNVVSED